MLRNITTRAALALPTALALTLICSPSLSYGQNATGPTDPTNLQSQLIYFADNETAPGSTPKLTNQQKASADNLVLALVAAIEARLADADANNDTPQAIGDLARQTLNTPRADANKIVGRIVNAAILASGAQGDAERIKAIVTEVGNVVFAESGGKTLSPAGKALVIASALKASAPTETPNPAGDGDEIETVGAALAESANLLAGDGNKLAFATSILKQLGTNTTNVPEFVNGILDGNNANTDTAAVALAKSVSSVPAIAGAVIAGRVADITSFGTVQPTSTVNSLLALVVKDAKLAKAVSESIALSDDYLGNTDRVALATELKNANPKVAGAVAAGFIRNADEGDVQGFVNATITSTTVPASVAFAGLASAGVGENADEVFDAVLTKVITGATATDKTNAQKLAASVANSVALTNPDAAEAVGRALADATVTVNGSSTNLYSDTELNTLAGAVAKAVNKNYTATGAVVAGVASALNDQGSASLARLSSTAINSNAKAAAGIALQVSQLLTGSADVTAYAKSLTTDAGFRSTNTPLIALGIALRDPLNSGLNTSAIIDQTPVLQRSALTIAKTVASGVDIESIAEVAEEVGKLFQPKTGGRANLPKVTQLPTFARTMTQAINAKPVAPKATTVNGRGAGNTLYGNFTWANRVDEIGELAASLVNAALMNGGDDAKLIASIGTTIFKSVSQKLLANAGLNQADIKDVAQDVAGAIFQAIRVAPVGGSFTEADRTALLTAGSGTAAAPTLLGLLSKGAGTKYSSFVQIAFADVTERADADGYYRGPKTELNSNLVTSTYEVGSIIEQETPTINL